MLERQAAAPHAVEGIRPPLAGLPANSRSFQQGSALHKTRSTYRRLVGTEMPPCDLSDSASLLSAEVEALQARHARVQLLIGQIYEATFPGCFPAGDSESATSAILAGVHSLRWVSDGYQRANASLANKLASADRRNEALRYGLEVTHSILTGSVGAAPAADDDLINKICVNIGNRMIAAKKMRAALTKVVSNITGITLSGADDESLAHTATRLTDKESA